MAAVAPQVWTECKFLRTVEVATFALAVRCSRDGGSRTEEMT
jgi:hypothetical protein